MEKMNNEAEVHFVELEVGENQGRSQNLKEVPQNSRKFLTLMMSQLMTAYGETNIAKKNY